MTGKIILIVTIYNIIYTIVYHSIKAIIENHKRKKGEQ